MAGSMSLLKLPLDLVYEIASHLDDDGLNKFIQTCSPLYSVFNFELWRRDAKRERSRALFWAVWHNRENTLRKSLQAGARAPWETLLGLAVEKDAALVVKVLLEQDGVDISMLEEFKGIPLLAKAVVQRSAKVVRFLLTREDLNPNIKDDARRTPLAFAVNECFNDIVKVLLRSPRVNVNCTDLEGCTPLHLAAAKSHVYVVRTLLAHPSVDVNARDWYNRSPLSTAVGSLRRALSGRAEKVKLKHRWTVQALLQHPAISVNYATDPVLVVMYRISAQYGYEDLFRLLFSKGEGQLPADLDRSGILFFVAKHGQVRIMKVLFAEGYEPEAKKEGGRTALSIAAEHKQIEIIRLLLSTGKVDVNSKDEDGQSPLWWAMTHGWKKTGTDETLKLLIDRGATIPTIKPKDVVLKALYKALEHGNCFLSELLLDQLDRHKPISGMTRRLLMTAVAKSKDILLAETVVERAKIDLNTTDSSGQTMLHWAISNCDLLLVDLILALNGVDVNSRDSNGDTPLAIAMKELSKCSAGDEQRLFYETCVDKLLRHEDVTTASLELDWLVDYLTTYLANGGDQKLMKLLILKDDRLFFDTVVDEDNGETLLEWAQENSHRTVVRALNQKGTPRIYVATEAATTEAETTEAATTESSTTEAAATESSATEAGMQTYTHTCTFTMEQIQRGVAIQVTLGRQ